MRKYIFVFLTFAAIGTAYADEAEFRVKVEAALPNTTINEIKPAEVDGLYEVTAGKNILYVDKDVKYLFVGGIYDLADNKNLTEARLRELNRVEFGSLPFDNAIKIGNGERKIAIFYDPDCPYCRNQYQELKKAGITAYIFLYPLPMHPKAYDKSVDIWCAKDKVKTLEYWMSGKATGKIKSCDTPINKNIELAEELQITATPTMILDTGEVIAGFVSALDLRKRMGINEE